MKDKNEVFEEAQKGLDKIADKGLSDLKERILNLISKYNSIAGQLNDVRQDKVSVLQGASKIPQLF